MLAYPPHPPYSYRSDTGSRRVARRAGQKQAASDTNVSSATMVVSVAESGTALDEHAVEQLSDAEAPRSPE